MYGDIRNIRFKVVFVNFFEVEVFIKVSEVIEEGDY